MSAFPVYVINLDRSPDRLVAIGNDLAKLGMAWERVRAVDGSELALPDSRIVDEKAFRRRHHALLRRGEIGCYLSHYTAIRHFLASDASAALILEDDAKPAPELPQVLSALADCTDKWDLVKLYATHPGGIIRRGYLGAQHRLVSLAFRHASSAAYVLNRRAAQKLADRMLPMTVPYDHEFDRSWKYGFRLRAVLPWPVTRPHVPSTISGTATLDPTARSVNARLHKPWYAQGGMVIFRGANDVARVIHELRQ